MFFVTYFKIYIIWLVVFAPYTGRYGENLLKFLLKFSKKIITVLYKLYKYNFKKKRFLNKLWVRTKVSVPTLLLTPPPQVSPCQLFVFLFFYVQTIASGYDKFSCSYITNVHIGRQLLLYRYDNQTIDIDTRGDIVFAHF